MAAAPNASTNPKNGRNHSRLSFAKITDTLTVPDLLALQTESFDWLVGNDVWKARLAEGQEQGRTDLALHSGLEEIFEEISPIEDLGETMQLSFTAPEARRPEVLDRRLQGARQDLRRSAVRQRRVHEPHDG